MIPIILPMIKCLFPALTASQALLYKLYCYRLTPLSIVLTYLENAGS